MSYELIFPASHIGNIHVMGRWAKIFKLLASEDVNGNQMDLSVTMLAGLRSAHFDNFAGTTFNDDETVLAERRALHRKGS